MWGSCPFAEIHFQESDLSFCQNLNFGASIKAPDLAWFPEVIKRTLPHDGFCPPKGTRNERGVEGVTKPAACAQKLAGTSGDII